METNVTYVYGPYVGRIGNVINYYRCGRASMRMRPSHYSDPKSEKQVHQRAKFSLVQRWLRPFSGLLRYSMSAKVGSTGYATACGYNLRNAVTGTYPNYVVNYSLAKVSVGSLPVLRDVTSQLSTSGLKVSWTDNSAENDGCDSSDRVFVLLYDVDKADAVYKLEAATRGEEQLTYSFPTGWAGDTVEVWIGAKSEDGRLSDSQYVGEFTAA